MKTADRSNSAYPMPTPINLRKVAIVVAALSPSEADWFLDRFSADEAQRVRQAVMELGECDPAEERRVLDEFFRARSRTPALNPYWRFCTRLKPTRCILWPTIPAGTPSTPAMRNTSKPKKKPKPSAAACAARLPTPPRPTTTDFFQ